MGRAWLVRAWQGRESLRRMGAAGRRSPNGGVAVLVAQPAGQAGAGDRSCLEECKAGGN